MDEDIFQIKEEMPLTALNELKNQLSFYSKDELSQGISFSPFMYTPWSLLKHGIVWSLQTGMCEGVTADEPQMAIVVRPSSSWTNKEPASKMTNMQVRSILLTERSFQERGSQNYCFTKL